MKHLYVLMSWPEDIDMLWIKLLNFASFFQFCELLSFHIFKDKYKMSGDINYLNLLV